MSGALTKREFPRATVRQAFKPSLYSQERSSRLTSDRSTGSRTTDELKDRGTFVAEHIECFRVTYLPGNMKARIEDRVIYSPYPHIDIPVCSFYALAKEKLLINPNKIALVGDELSLTRAEVLASMQRYAVGFRQNGMLPGDHVCIHMNNSVENLIAIYGCILAGGTVFLAYALLTEDELRNEVQDGDCTHVVTDEENAVKVRKALAGLKLKGRFCVGQAADFVSTSEFLKIDEKEFRECPVADPQNNVLAVCYTSGTTGLPKGAEMTHYSYVACFYASR
ncbi:hypothetical protein HPB49_022633 [Dermacentor silvarum]|uniref:Uncharacterized protein n=1 Tax=Dermacentor silvarum TaxID=543639 RepID=A0ACB8C5U0_DERSI|nr:hypothetical protein HPB49_022633 [Dermacentor silvarum]